MRNGYARYALIDSREIKRIARMRRRKKFFAVVAACVIIMGSFALGLRLGTDNPDFVARHEVEQMLNDFLAEVSQQNEQSLHNIFASAPTYNNAADIFRAIDNSVVSINIVQQHLQFGRMQDRHSAGSGVIFHEDDTHIFIATNYHVIQGAYTVTISLDDVRTAPANFVGGDERNDLAVISVLRENLRVAGITNYKVAAFGDSDAMEIGNFVLAVGNAYGEGQSATLGIVSALNKTITLEVGFTLNVLQTDAAINFGNSGGPLVNTRGEVIGINTARFGSPHSEGMGYAIPSNDAARILSQILESGNIVRPVLGVTFETVTEYLRDRHNLDSVGVFIGQVVRGYTAHNIGLLPGDIIIRYNGSPVTTTRQLTALIAATPIGSEVVVTVMREGQEIVLSGHMESYHASSTNF